MQSFGYAILELCICVCVGDCVIVVHVLKLSVYFQVDLQPSGKVMMSVQFFLEDADTG